MSGTETGIKTEAVTQMKKRNLETEDLLSDSTSLLDLTKGHKVACAHFCCHM